MKQVNVGPWWGRFLQSISQLSLVVGLLNLFLLLMTMTTSEGFRYFMTAHGLNIPMEWIFVAVAVLLVIALLLAYKYSMASSFEVWNEQWWNHRNPLKDRIERIEANQKLLLKMLDEKSDNLLSTSSNGDRHCVMETCTDCPIYPCRSYHCSIGSSPAESHKP